MSESGQREVLRISRVFAMSSAETFAGLHKPGDPLLLPNAWDVASAVTIAGAGAKAIATTSAGVAWSLGVADAANFGTDRAAAVVARIVQAVDVPVTADIEAGYDSVADTMTAVLEAGAVGVNIEDRSDGRLLAPGEQAEQLAAARAAADKLGIPAWINARTDVYLTRDVPPEDRLSAVFERAAAYAEAGADSLFAPGLIDLASLAELTTGPLPIAVMVWAGAPTVSELAAVGVARISLGGAIAQAAYALAARATTEMLTQGTYDTTADGIAYDTTNQALSRG
jgi:2-methylisocitrate lyase-like PEP mutase family enzyme